VWRPAASSLNPTKTSDPTSLRSAEEIARDIDVLLARGARFRDDRGRPLRTLVAVIRRVGMQKVAVQRFSPIGNRVAVF
jgi:hypothetical protein